MDRLVGQGGRGGMTSLLPVLDGEMSLTQPVGFVALLALRFFAGIRLSWVFRNISSKLLRSDSCSPCRFHPSGLLGLNPALRYFRLRCPPVNCPVPVWSGVSRVSRLRERSGLRLTTSSPRTVLRINLNIDGVPIASHTHTHPFHSQTSRLLSTSPSLDIPLPRST